MVPLLDDYTRQELRRFVPKLLIGVAVLLLLLYCLVQLANGIQNAARLQSSVAALALIPLRESDSVPRGYADLIFSGAIFAIAFCVSYEFLGGLAGVVL